MITTLLLVVVVFAMNVLVAIYARGVVRTAVADAARAGARVDLTQVSKTEAERRCADAAKQTMRGSYARDVTFTCAVTPRDVTVTATGNYPIYLMPQSVNISLDAASTFRRRPASTETP